MRRRLKVHKLGIIGGLLVLLMMVSVACEGPKPTATPTEVPTATATTAPTMTPTPEPSPTPLLVEALVEATAAAMRALKSSHVEADYTATLRVDDVEDGLIEMSMAGDLQAPDRAQIEMKMNVEEEDTETEFIIVANETYVRFPGTNIWHHYPTEDPVMPDLREALRFNPDEVADFALIGEEDLDGEQVYYLRGSLNFEGGGPLGDVPTTVDENSLLGEVVGEVEYWIGVADFLVRKSVHHVVVAVSPSVDEGAGMRLMLVITLSDYGKPVSIQAPEVGFTPTPGL